MLITPSELPAVEEQRFLSIYNQDGYVPHMRLPRGFCSRILSCHEILLRLWLLHMFSPGSELPGGWLIQPV